MLKSNVGIKEERNSQLNWVRWSLDPSSSSAESKSDSSLGSSAFPSTFLPNSISVRQIFLSFFHQWHSSKETLKCLHAGEVLFDPVSVAECWLLACTKLAVEKCRKVSQFHPSWILDWTILEKSFETVEQKWKIFWFAVRACLDFLDISGGSGRDVVAEKLQTRISDSRTSTSKFQAFPLARTRSEGRDLRPRVRQFWLEQDTKLKADNLWREQLELLFRTFLDLFRPSKSSCWGTSVRWCSTRLGGWARHARRRRKSLRGRRGKRWDRFVCWRRPLYTSWILFNFRTNQLFHLCN